MMRFKIDVLAALKEKGFTTYRIRKEKKLGNKTVADIASGIVPGIIAIENLCEMLEMQPGDLLEYIPDPENKTE